jgi:hypothetical protein
MSKLCLRDYEYNIIRTEHVGRSSVVCLINIIVDLTVDFGLYIKHIF